MPPSVPPLNRAALPGDLARFEREAEAMAAVALARLRADADPRGRERQFAESLQRHARGVKVAAAAWRQELVYQP